jgi:hypothetical protein
VGGNYFKLGNGRVFRQNKSYEGGIVSTCQKVFSTGTQLPDFVFLQFLKSFLFEQICTVLNNVIGTSAVCVESDEFFGQIFGLLKKFFRNLSGHYKSNKIFKILSHHLIDFFVFIEFLNVNLLVVDFNG